MKGDYFMTRDKIISKLLSVIRIMVLFFIIAYFYEYLLNLKQEHFNSIIIFITFLNTIIIFTERNEKNEK